MDANIERMRAASGPAAPTLSVLGCRLSGTQPTMLDAFRPLFDSAKAAMRRGDFNKIVPVQFESGRLLERAELWPWLLRRLASLPRGMTAYGYSYQNHGLAGASPEMLFESDVR